MAFRIAVPVHVQSFMRLTVAIAGMASCCAVARGDDVNLIPGTTFKQAIGGRVKGQVQSESPSEVVVQLGATATSVPTDQIQSIRYDGQSANFQLAEARESSGQLAEAAELFKKAAAESAGKPFPLQAALFREAEVLTDLALVEPDRVKEAKDKLAAFRADLSHQPPHRRRRASARLACNCTPATSPGPRPRSPSLPNSHEETNGLPSFVPGSWPSKANTPTPSPSSTS